MSEYTDGGGCGDDFDSVERWKRVAKLWMRQIKLHEKGSWFQSQAKRDAARACDKIGKFRVAACLWEEEECWEAAGKAYKWAANCELEDRQAAIDALNLSADCYDKYIRQLNPKDDIYKQVALKIQYCRSAARKMEERQQKRE